MKAHLRPWPALLFPILACGAPGVSLRYYEDLNGELFSRGAEAALQKLEGSKDLYGDKSVVLYHMDAAMLATLAGRYERSLAHIEAAEDAVEMLYTKSLTREAASFLTSDATLPYEGEDFEKVFLNVLAALNYAMLGQMEEAAVEARKADVKLAEIARSRGANTKYGEDPFVRFLMGLVYEEAGEVNDAYISYARAIETYERQRDYLGVEVPASLVQRAFRTAQALGFQEEASALQKKYASYLQKRPQNTKESGRIIVVDFAGLVPLKVEGRIEVTLAQGLVFLQSMEVSSKEEQDVSSALSIAKSVAGTTNIVIAYPMMSQPLPPLSRGEIVINGPTGRFLVREERAQNLLAIAPLCLQERLGRIWAKTVARAVVKFLLAYAAEKAGEAAGGKKYGWLTGFLAGAATGAALSASEHADTRSWGTLPAEVRIAVVEVPPGDYEVEFANGKVLSLKVEPQRATWVLTRSR